MNAPFERRGRILFVAHSMEVGGAERTLLQIMRHLVGSYDLYLASPNGPMLASFRPLCRSTVMLSKGYVPLLFNPAAYLRALFATFMNTIRLSRFMRRQPLDLVFTNTGVVIHGALAARMCRIPSVVMIHEIISPAILRRGLTRLLRSLNQRILVMSEAVRATLGAPRAAHQMVKVPAGIRLDGQADASVNAGPQVSPFFAAGAPVVGVVGGVHPIKGQHYFLLMAAEVARRVPSAVFVIVGAYQPRSRYYLRLRRLCTQLGLDHRVVFTGFIDPVDSILRQLTVLVVSSVTESLSMVSMEAMAMGKPVVAFDVGGVSEVVEDGVTGSLVPFGQCRAMAEAVCSLLEQPETAARMGAAGRARAEREFSATRQCAEIETALVDVLMAHAQPERKGTGL